MYSLLSLNGTLSEVQSVVIKRYLVWNLYATQPQTGIAVIGGEDDDDDDADCVQMLITFTL